MKKDMFAAEGKWYKGNLHAHTVNSDGRLTPAEMTEMYKSQGYHFLCLSEHDVYTDLRADFDRENFILLPGVEASVCLIRPEVQKSRWGEGPSRITEKEMYAFSRNRNLEKVHHIHGILGTEEMQKNAGTNVFRHGERLLPPVYYGRWNGREAAQDMIDYLRGKGCFVTYNHPAWSRVSMEEVTGLRDLWAMEVFNYGTEVECGEGYDKSFWDVMLRRGTRILGFASDDNHNLENLFDSFGGYVMVRSEALTHEAIVSHLLNGDYYFTGGPEIFQWGIEDEWVYVECSDAEKINFIAGGPVGSSETVLCADRKLREAHHRLNGKENYIRIECVDEQGRVAWTNPLWL